MRYSIYFLRRCTNINTKRKNDLKYFIAFCVIFPLFFYTATSATLTVGKGTGNMSLYETVKVSQRNDTIIVLPGHYFVKRLIITKPLTIIGKGKPVLDANNKSEAIIINSDSVEFSGFIIKNIPTNYIEDWAGIRLNNADFCKITNNELHNTFFGIYLNKSNNCIVRDNKVTGKAVKELSSGNAIHLWYSSHARIENNTVRKHRDGIYLEFVNNSKITGNISENNLRYGLHFMFSDSNLYYRNTFRHNGAGVAVMFSRVVDMHENTFSENTGASSYGLLLKEIFDSKVINNKIANNTVGIFAEGATRCRIENNEFSENGWAMKMLGSSSGNTIIQNNFISNTFDVSTNASTDNNIYSKNFWGKYTGYDLNHDGYGDVPHRPVKLFSYISSNSNESLILLRSLFVSIIDFAESITPVFTPTGLKDNKPLMKPAKFNE